MLETCKNKNTKNMSAEHALVSFEKTIGTYRYLRCGSDRKNPTMIWNFSIYGVFI
jgi:hypothetical protein